MKEIIATGKTVDLAIEEACQQLGVPREKAEFEKTLESKGARNSEYRRGFLKSAVF